MLQEPVREAILKAIDVAVKNKVQVSFESTLRLDVWNTRDEINGVYEKVSEKTDIATF